MDRLAERVQEYWENLPEETNEQLYPEVKNVLKTLTTKGIILGVVSNRLSGMSEKSLETHSIKRFFHCVIGPKISGAPNGKNSPEMWQFALNTVGCKPEEVLHIDDEDETGIVGAKQAGIQPILLDRKGMYTSYTDCILIHNLTEILDF